MLRPDQLAIAKHPARFKVLCMGRRWGKTVLGGTLGLNAARQGGLVMWMGLSFPNTRQLWSWALRYAWPAIKGGYATFNKTEKSINFKNGGQFLVFSGDSYDGVRGMEFNLAILDEAAKINEEAWYGAVRPTLATTNGSAFIISSPHGKNWFYHAWARGQDPLETDWQSWRAPTNANPIPEVQADMITAKRDTPERTYREEWLAEFVDDGGEVFRRVRPAQRAIWQDTAIAGHQYVIGADWGRSNDYTVFAVADVTEQAIVHIDRSNQIEYALQRGRIEALYRRFHATAIVAESNAMGEPIIELMRRDGLNVIPFQTTNATKQAIIDALANAFERDAIGLPKDGEVMPVVIGELEAFSMTRLPSGLIRYEAPSGMHDDCVMAIALAWHGAAGQFEPAYGMEAINDEEWQFSPSPY